MTLPTFEGALEPSSVPPRRGRRTDAAARRLRPSARARATASLRRCATCALIAGVWGCSSSEGEVPAASRREDGTGGELAAPAANPVPSPASASSVAEGGGEGSASVSEARDPSRLPNVVPPSDPGRVPARPSSGCGELGSSLTSGEQSLDVAGVERTYVLDLPATYDGAAPYPLVFAFHGATTSGAFFRSARYGNLLSTMAAEAIVVHADALGDPTSWNNGADLPFFDALLAALDGALCVDLERVFATGHSSGGFFTNALGCQRGDVLRAIAPVSAGGPFGGRCTGDVAVWLAHAENDETVAFQNGVQSRDRWLEANGCTDTTVPSERAPCSEYAGCAEGRSVRWCVYDDGHAWPEFAPLGIWSFFSAL